MLNVASFSLLIKLE